MLPEILAVTLPKTRNSTNRPLDRLIGPGPVLYRQCSMLSVEWAAPETRLHHRQPFRKQARPILARPVGVNSVEHGAPRCARRSLCPLARGPAPTLSLAPNAHSNRGARGCAQGINRHTDG